MNIHEYQAKRILKDHGVAILSGKVALSPEEAVMAAQEIGQGPWVVKAQIHAGGRGKAGGIVLACRLEDVKKATEKLLKAPFVTPQTGEKGQLAQKVYIEQGCAIEREFYLSFVINRQIESVSLIASSAGGMDIEEVARQNPTQVLTFTLDPACGIQKFHARRIGVAFGFSGDTVHQLADILEKLYCLFIKKDCLLLEVNPLVLTKEGRLVALDAKMTFDENALIRQPSLEHLRDESQENPIETRARAHDLSYVQLEGNIGCMVNGAGLAMATMDIINLHQGKPANFLDVGGGATQEKIREAFKLILESPNIQAIFINIFGGIMRCDVLAQGIVQAAQDTPMHVPVMIRLQGTNKELGEKILKESSLDFFVEDDFSRAAEHVVQLARKRA